MNPSPKRVLAPGQYKTRSGETATVLGSRLDITGRCLIGYIHEHSGPAAWYPDGTYAANQHDYDLMPPMKKVWVNLYPATETAAGEEGWDMVANQYESKADADNIFVTNWMVKRLACVQIEVPA